VRNARKAKRDHKKWPSAEAWTAYQEALSAKGVAIQKAKAAHFKQAVADTARGGRGIWPLAKWARQRSHLPSTSPTIPNLVTPFGRATTYFEEAEALKSRSFPPMPSAYRTDMPRASHPAEIASPMSISEEEISSLIKKSQPFKAAGSNGIPCFDFKCLGGLLVSFLQPLFQTCTYLSYHTTLFCHYNKVPLIWPGKGDYSAPKAWRPIALINTVRKVLESVIARRISSLSEEHSLLPAQHMGARPGRSIETAIDYLV
jgi:hypothetical protein